MAASTANQIRQVQLIGVPAAAVVLVELFTAAKLKAGIAQSVPLRSVGACMSGFMEAGPQVELVDDLRAKAPSLADEYYIDNDSPGSVYTAAGSAGGAVIIAGTGTMGQLIKLSGGIVSCGGHGHMYGDEGSAYYIAAEAIRKIHHVDDGFSDDPAGATPLPDVTRARAAMLAYFNIPDSEGMLEVMYKAFKKDRVAGFTKVLAGLARGDGEDSTVDPFCASLFAHAGALLGCKARSLAAHALSAGALPSARFVHDFTIVAVGSVWKSWDLLRPSFLTSATAPFPSLPSSVLLGSGQGEAQASVTGRRVPSVNVTHLPAEERGRLASFRLVRLKVTSAVGAAWRGAQLKAGVTLPLDSAANCETMYAHTA